MVSVLVSVLVRVRDLVRCAVTCECAALDAVECDVERVVECAQRGAHEGLLAEPSCGL